MRYRGKNKRPEKDEDGKSWAKYPARLPAERAPIAGFSLSKSKKSKPTSDRAVATLVSRLSCATCALVAGCTYLSTVSPGVAGGDTGELLAESWQLGTAHPPGYPLFTLLYHIVMHYGAGIGRGSPAWRANVLSAVLGGMTAGLAAASVTLLAKRCQPMAGRGDSLVVAICACAAGWLWAFSPLTWQYSVTAEVFALNNFLVALLVHRAVVFSQGRALRDAALGAFISGLCLSNQHTSVLLVAPMALWVLWQLATGASAAAGRRQGCNGWAVARRLCLLGCMGLAGLAPYIYLPVAARLAPKTGSWGDVASFWGFIRHVRRADYGSLQLYSGDDKGSEDLWARLLLWLEDLTCRQGLWVTPMLALGGAAALWQGARITTRKKPRAEAARTRFGLVQRLAALDDSGSSIGPALTLSLLLYLLVFNYLSNMPLEGGKGLLWGVHARFWMQPNLLVFILAGTGWSCLYRGVGGRTGLMMALLGTAASAAAQVWRWHDAVDQSEAVYFSKYARGLLEAMPVGSVLLINNDQVWTSTRYSQICEQVRPDVTLLNMSMMTFEWWATKAGLYPHLTFPGGRYSAPLAMAGDANAFTMQSFMRANLESTEGGLFIEGPINFIEPGLADEFTFVPHGLVSRVMPSPVSFHDFMPVAKGAMRSWSVSLGHFSSASLPPLQKYGDEWWESTLWPIFWKHVSEGGAALLEAAVTKPEKDGGREIDLLILAMLLLEHTVDGAAQGELEASVLKNLGLAYMHLVRSPLERESSLPQVPDVFQASNLLPFSKEPSWKAAASRRFVEVWARFISHPDAREDPQYDNIEAIYKSVTGTGPTLQ